MSTVGRQGENWAIEFTKQYIPNRHRSAALKWFTTAPSVTRECLHTVLLSLETYRNNCRSKGISFDRNAPVSSGASAVSQASAVSTSHLPPDVRSRMAPVRGALSSSSQRLVGAWLTQASPADCGRFSQSFGTLAKALASPPAAAQNADCPSGVNIRSNTPTLPPAALNLHGMRSPSPGMPPMSASSPVPGRGQGQSLGFQRASNQIDQAEAAVLNKTDGAPHLFPKSNKHKPSRHLWDGKPPYAKLAGPLDDSTTMGEFFPSPEKTVVPVICSRKNPSGKMNSGDPPFARVGGFHETQTRATEDFGMRARTTEPHIPKQSVISKKNPQRHLYDCPAPFAKLEPLDPLPVSKLQPTDADARLLATGKRSPNVSRKLLDGESPYAKLSNFVNLTTSNTFSRHYTPEPTNTI